MRHAAFLIAALVLSIAPTTRASAQGDLQGFAMRPPCAGAPLPAPASPGGSPAIATWTEKDAQKAPWQMSSCLDWTDGPPRLATALVAELTAPSLDDLLRRYGALSRYSSIRVWSTLKQDWVPFTSAAGATEGAAATATLPDLVPADFVPGRSRFYYDIDPRTGRTVHRLTVVRRTADRIEITTENVTPMTYAVFTIFESQALRTATIFERHGPQRWGYIQAIGAGRGANFLAVRSPSPYINRLAALHRYMAGLPTDGAPPVAPN